jgi:hypothetical protein
MYTIAFYYFIKVKTFYKSSKENATEVHIISDYPDTERLKPNLNQFLADSNPALSWHGKAIYRAL